MLINKHKDKDQNKNKNKQPKTNKKEQITITPTRFSSLGKQVLHQMNCRDPSRQLPTNQRYLILELAPDT